MKNKEIAIIGAGIGGITTAISLKMKGFNHITIYERRQTATTIGAGLVLWANAVKILKKLDLFTAIEKIGGKLGQMQRYTSENEFLGAIDIDRINTVIGATSFSVSRADLQQVLVNKAIELKITIVYNHPVKKLISNIGKTTIVFESDIRITPDIVIGSDGRMNSIARKYVLGENKPIYQGFVNWIGIVETDTPSFSDSNVLDFWGVGQRFGLVPINECKAYWAGGMSLPLNAPEKQGNFKEEMHNMFASWSPKIKEIIALTPSENIKYIEVFDHNPTNIWFKDTVCMLGDSAHAALPTSGQGACQAIEDAWHFTKCLAAANSIEGAFKAFKELRFNKTTSITMAGRNLATSLFNNNPSYCQQRNAQAKQSDYKAASQNIAALWGSGL